MSVFGRYSTRGRRLAGATPRPRSGGCVGAGGLRVRRGGGEEIPLVQGKRNPSKTVGVARGIRGQTHKP